MFAIFVSCLVLAVAPVPPASPARDATTTTTSAPTPAAPAQQLPLKLASPNLSGLNIPESAAAFYSEHLAQQIASLEVEVTTAKQISSMLGFERQKSLLGCNDGSCLSELAAALGVDGIVIGDIGKFGNKYQLNLRVLSAKDGRVLSAFSSRVEGDEAVLDELVSAARKMVPEVDHKLGRHKLRKSSSSSSRASGQVSAPAGGELELAPATGGMRRYAWVPATVGGLAVLGGALCLLQSDRLYTELQSPDAPLRYEVAQQRAAQGKLFQTVGAVGIGLGVAGLAAAGVMALLGPPSSSTPQVALAISQGSAFVAVEGEFP